MEENVALDSNKQKQFVKSIKGIKKLIKKNVAKSTVEAPQDVKVKEKPIAGKIRKRKPKRKGLVYLGHIPHGFYEHEMTQYFKQFGVVTNARVIRSKRTGNSKGYAFVEFKEPTVAEIVAETMNNYLMGKRLIKSAYIPPEKQRRHVFRKHWSANNNPGNSLRIKMKKAHNAEKDEQGELQRVKKLLSNLSKNKKKLRELGINYDFFTPVDMPAALIKVEDENENKKDNEEIKKGGNAAKTKKGAKKDKVAEDKEAVKDIKSKKKAVTSVQLTQSQPGKKEKQEHAKQTQPGKKEKVEQLTQKQQSKQEIVDQSKQKKQAKKDVDLPKQKQQAKKDVDQSKQNQLAKKENIGKLKQSEPLKKEKADKLKKDIQEKETNKNLQKKKQQDLKDKGVKPLEDFLKVQESDDESNSSYAFDSDEYEKMIENENESGSDVSDDNSEGDYSSDEEVADSDASSEESEVEPPPKKQQKAKPVPKLAQPLHTKKNANKQEVQIKIPQQGKRKAPQPQKAVVGAAPKKQKFEKQNNQKARNKQFKKK